MTALRLLPPVAVAPLPELDGFQRAVVDAVERGGTTPLVVTGEPGSGKTVTAVSLVTGAITGAGIDPSRVLLISATRKAAAATNDWVAQLAGVAAGAPSVRTASSLAHGILAQRARALGEPAPTLITGADQDVILKQMLAAHSAGVVPGPSWDGVVPAAATAHAGFRAELRSVLMRATEAGLGPRDLGELGRRAGEPAWEAVATLFAEYRDVLALRGLPADQGERYDSAEAVAEAAYALANWPAQAGTAPSWELVVVDDYHDATRAVTELVGVIARGGARVVVFGNADQAIQGYRGGQAGALDTALRSPRHGGLGAEQLELGPSRRQPASLAALTRMVVERIGVSGAGSARHAHTAGRERTDPAPVTVLAASHDYGQSRGIAAQLRRAHHGRDAEPVAWSQMVVIARSAARLRALRSDLLACDIPCETLGDATALHVEPAVAPLLSMMALALGGKWDEAAATLVLTSRLVGLDPVAMRRLRRSLVRDDRAAGGTAPSAQLLAEAMANPAGWSPATGGEGVRAARASHAVAAGAVAASVAGATAGSVLWAMWDALGVAEQWRAAAIAGSARDDADLDAVVALMRAAQLFSERMPQAGPEAFVDYLESQEFAADSLGARAQAADVVSFATPAGAAGREWELVVVAGLEEGVWPNVRLRDSVLGAQRLADIAAGRAAPEPLGEGARVESAHAARRAVIDDETRALAVAVSRARQQLLVTFVDCGDARASRYVAWLTHAAGVDVERAEAIRGVADLRGAVAQLRSSGVAARGAARGGYAAVLAHLAHAGVEAAHPDQWHGVPELSTTASMWEADSPVRVSPSKVDAVELCALRWALESAGGTRESSSKQQLGTLIHEIAAALPTAGHAELAATLEARWHELGLADSWPARVERAKADAMVAKLAAYIKDCAAGSVAVEQSFVVTLGRAVLAGQADRVEITGTTARIVDLKTGAAIARAEVADHGQLAMYQLAANLGGFHGVEAATGAALLYVGEPKRVSPNVLAQPVIDTQAQQERLAAVVDTMSAPVFIATTNDQCPRCPVARACPARPTGMQVSDQ